MSTSLAQPAARQLWAGLRMLLVLTVLLGLAYPLAMTGVAQVAFPGRADGSLVERDGKVVGSSLIGQSFDGAARSTSRAGPPPPATATTRSPRPPPTSAPRTRTWSRRSRSAARRRPSSTAPHPAEVAPDALLASGSGLDPHISPAYAAQQVARVARERGMSAGRGPRARRRSTPRAAPSASSASRGVNVLHAQPGPRRGQRNGRLGTWARAAGSGSTSAQRPGWARPTPCSARGTAAPSAAPTSSSGSSRPTAAAHRRDGRGARGRPAPDADLPRHARSRRWTSTPCWPAGRRWRWSTSSPTPTSPARATPSAGRTSRSCSPRASTSSPPSTSSTSSRSTTSSRRSPAYRSARPCPTRSSGPRTRSSWRT